MNTGSLPRRQYTPVLSLLRSYFKKFRKLTLRISFQLHYKISPTKDIKAWVHSEYKEGEEMRRDDGLRKYTFGDWLTLFLPSPVLSLLSPLPQCQGLAPYSLFVPMASSSATPIFLQLHLPLSSIHPFILLSPRSLFVFSSLTSRECRKSSITLPT